MSFTSTPNSIILLQVITESLASISAVFDPKSPGFETLKDTLIQTGPFKENPAYLTNPEIITYTQTLFLTGLSLYSGILMSSIQNITVKNKLITVDWGNQIRESLTLGKHDNAYDHFISYYQSRLFGKRHQHTPLSTLTLHTLHRLIKSHIDLLNTTATRINLLYENKLELKQLFQEELQQDLLFILIACMPDTQINALFLHIQSFFPDNLEIKSPDGNTININLLLQSPSTDIQYLLGKVRIYLELYYSPDLPIIKHITQSKTQEFLIKLTQNKQVYAEVQRNLNNIQEIQLKPRKTLYTLFDTHLNLLLTS